MGNEVEISFEDKYKEEMVLTAELLSIGKGMVQIGEERYQIGGDAWTKIKINLAKRRSCRAVIKIVYNGTRVNKDGRILTFAIRQIKIKGK